MTERKTKINSIKPSQRAYDALLEAVHAQKMKGHAATYAEIIDIWLDAATNSVPISEQKLPNVKNGIESVQTSKDAAITPTLRPYVDLLILIAGRGGAEWEATKGCLESLSGEKPRGRNERGKVTEIPGRAGHTEPRTGARPPKGNNRSSD